MGGTRCVFHNCKVSSQRNPKMHFFKLPVRHPERLEAWLKNCSNEEITELADLKKLANRAVCARHFRMECFMNYKMDRLIASQMPKPTLIRINKYLAWDIENLDENGDPKMVKLEKPTAKHLIPPPGFECPLGLDDNDDEIDDDDDKKDNEKKAMKTSSSEVETAGDVQKIDLKATKRTKEAMKTSPSEVETAGDVQKIDLKATKRTKEAMKTLPSEVETAGDVQKIDLKATKRKEEAPDQLQDEASKRLKVINFPLENERHSLENVEDKINPNVDSIETSIQKTAHEELKLKYEKLLAEHDLLKKSKASEMHSQITNSSSSRSAHKPLTKTQLYQGLKKYLGPTMAALVRMEIFGGSDERDWQDDERQFAMELLQLGEEIYTYCSDEWRFRLPSLRLVRSWLSHQSKDEML